MKNLPQYQKNFLKHVHTSDDYWVFEYDAEPNKKQAPEHRIAHFNLSKVPFKQKQ